MYKIRIIVIATLIALGTLMSFSPVFASEPSNIFYGKNYILLDKYTGYAGTTVMVRGYGFEPNETVQVYLRDSKDHTVVEVTTSAFGNFNSTEIKIPEIKSGKYKVYGYGTTSNNRASANFYVRNYSPSARPDDYYVHVGDFVGYIGTGFKPNSEIKLYHDNGKLIHTFTSDASGNFTESDILEIIPEWEDDVIKQYFVEPSSGKEIKLRITVAKEY